MTKNIDLLVTRNNPQTGKSVQVLPEFVNLNYKLYQYVGNGQYSQIDTLGEFGFLEYNQNERNVKSLLLDNKSNIDLSTETKLDETTDNTTEVTNNQAPIDRISSYGFNKDAKTVLEVIINSPNKLHAELAKQLLKQNLVGINHVVEVEQGRKGSYNYDTNTIRLNPDEIESNNTFEQVYLHELVHHFTGATLLSGTKTPEQERITKSLIALMKVLVDKIQSNPEHADRFQEFKDAMAKRTGASEHQISRYYGATDVREFVTMAMTDPKFQQILNDLPFSGEKTILDRFLDLVKELLNSIGFEIKKDSVLEYAIENIVELINLTNSEFVEESMDLTSESPSSKNELPELKPC